MKAASISAGAAVRGADNSRKSAGIFTAARALRMVSKYARGLKPEQVPCFFHSLKISPGAGIRSSIEVMMLRSRYSADRWQYSGKPRSYCGHRPCTPKETGRPPHWAPDRPLLPRSEAASQNDGDQD